MKHLDLTNKKFGLLTAVALVGRNFHNHLMWLCNCECGSVALVPTENLQSGNTKSCGCLKAKQKGASRKTGTLYAVWRGMMRRCYEESSHAFNHYGGRGIYVCERWHSYLNFEEDMTPRPEGMTLDRIDNDKGYSPENCRWATPKEQANNRRPCSKPRKDSQMLEFNGEVLSVRKWAEKLGMKKGTLIRRLKSGWSISRALTEAVHEEFANATA